MLPSYEQNSVQIINHICPIIFDIMDLLGANHKAHTHLRGRDHRRMNMGGGDHGATLETIHYTTC